jgi:hypothetical protein
VLVLELEEDEDEERLAVLEVVELALLEASEEAEEPRLLMELDKEDSREEIELEIEGARAPVADLRSEERELVTETTSEDMDDAIDEGAPVRVVRAPPAAEVAVDPGPSIAEVAVERAPPASEVRELMIDPCPVTLEARAKIATLLNCMVVVCEFNF